MNTADNMKILFLCVVFHARCTHSVGTSPFVFAPSIVFPHHTMCPSVIVFDEVHEGDRVYTVPMMRYGYITTLRLLYVFVCVCDVQAGEECTKPLTKGQQDSLNATPQAGRARFSMCVKEATTANEYLSRVSVRDLIIKHHHHHHPCVCDALHQL